MAQTLPYVTGAATWAWLHVIRPSWISLLVAPVVLAGYRLLGRKRREGWWLVIASQVGLLAIGLVDQQFGLGIVLLLIREAFQNWRRWGRPEGVPDLRGEVVRGALWALDLTRLYRPEIEWHRLIEVESGAQVEQLARAMAVDERVVRQRLARGCRAFAAWSPRDGVVSWLWVSTGEEYAPPFRRTLQIPEGDCHGWGAGTLEGHRGRGLYTRVLEYAGWCMAGEGMRAMWNGILDENLASQRAHARAGMRPVVRVAASHGKAGGRLLAWPIDYADPRLVGRALQMLGAESAAEGAADDFAPAGRQVTGVPA